MKNDIENFARGLWIKFDVWCNDTCVDYPSVEVMFLPKSGEGYQDIYVDDDFKVVAEYIDEKLVIDAAHHRLGCGLRAEWGVKLASDGVNCAQVVVNEDFAVKYIHNNDGWDNYFLMEKLKRVA